MSPQMFSNIQFASGVSFYYKSYGAGQALMVRNIKAITQIQQATLSYDSIWSNLYPKWHLVLIIIYYF